MGWSDFPPPNSFIASSQSRLSPDKDFGAGRDCSPKVARRVDSTPIYRLRIWPRSQDAFYIRLLAPLAGPVTKVTRGTANRSVRAQRRHELAGIIRRQ